MTVLHVLHLLLSDGTKVADDEMQCVLGLAFPADHAYAMCVFLTENFMNVLRDENFINMRHFYKKFEANC